MNISLSQFCRDYGIAKTTAYRFCQEQNISVTEGLDPDTVALLKSEFNLDRPQGEPEAVRPEVLPDGFWQSSALAPVQHRDIQLPNSFDPSAMVRFFDGVAGQTTDTQQLVEIAKIAIDSANSAMDQKLEAQRQSLRESERNAKQLESLISEAKTSMQIKALESKMIAQNQTQLTSDAEAIFAQLMGLGKPADG